jgi:8-oxo-(d)GTP phosphatase
MTGAPGRPGEEPERLRTIPTLYLVRHGKAENRERWDAPDSERPLVKRGIEQSRLIAGHLVDLVGRAPSRVLSSPAVRCQQTVEPLATASALAVVETQWLNEGSDGQYAFEQLRKLAVRLDPPSGVGGPVAACSHGDVIWEILERLVRLGVDLGRQPDAPKGGVWIIGTTATTVVHASLYEPDTGGRGSHSGRKAHT